jgi:signal transduction histidine kinase
VSDGLQAELGALEVFRGLTDQQLDWLATHGQVVEIPPGETLFREGDPADALYVVLQGSLELLLSIGGQFVPAWTQHVGAVTGLLPYSRMQRFTGRGRAVGLLRLLTIPREALPAMLQAIPELGQRMVSLMADRVRDATRLVQQREKMSALGTLAAGLAHELNNPAAAVRRDAEALSARITALAGLAGQLCAAGLDDAAIAAVGAKIDALSSRPSVSLDALTRSRREEDLGEWLDSRGVDEAWSLAGTLADAGVTPDDLDALAGSADRTTVTAVIRWVEALVEATRLSRAIGSASARISELVQSVKVYSHMDRGGDRQPIDVREGLDSTLVMLGHKLKKKVLRLERRYDADLPRVNGFAGELNQVWTNLVDNAIDAAPEGGVLGIDASRDGSVVEVRVSDNGSGIPPSILSRIFEPFFTTKPVGQGTGLGLDVVQRVVSDRHGGRVDVDSMPGHTVFTVRLPLDAASSARPDGPEGPYHRNSDSS